MSKYRGRNFEDYLKEKGISEEVSARAKSGGRFYAPRHPSSQKIRQSPQVIHLNKTMDFSSNPP